MTPGLFDTQTCRRIVGDERARVIEANARRSADSGEQLVRPESCAKTYWDGVQEESEWRVACAAYTARAARITRKLASEAKS